MSTGLELHLVSARASAAGPGGREHAERDRLIRRAKNLSWLSLAYMSVEGAVGITALIRAPNGSRSASRAAR
jgi:hypothetical protein